MRILLLGKYGQLGWELQRCLAPLGIVRSLDFPEIDLAQPDSIRLVVRQFHPEVIINATAYTAVDKAEIEQESAEAINGIAPGILGEEALLCGAALIHYSTDYVFDGNKGSPYIESDAPNPLSVYGRSKLHGEQAIEASGCLHLIFRTAWVYSLRRDSFVTKVLSWARQQTTLRVVSDQVSNPTWARLLAEISAQVLSRHPAIPGEKIHLLDWLGERGGLYHLAGDGFASRLEWAEAILKLDPNRQEQLTCELLPASSAEFPTPATRPLFSALDCQRFKQTFGLCLPDWRQALGFAMDSS